MASRQQLLQLVATAMVVGSALGGCVHDSSAESGDGSRARGHALDGPADSSVEVQAPVTVGKAFSVGLIGTLLAPKQRRSVTLESVAPRVISPGLEVVGAELFPLTVTQAEIVSLDGDAAQHYDTKALPVNGTVLLTTADESQKLAGAYVVRARTPGTYEIRDWVWHYRIGSRQYVQTIPEHVTLHAQP